MRIALFSDIHGNLTGVEAILEKLDAEGGADLTIAAGDFIAGESGTDDLLELLLSRNVQMVKGDSDTDKKYFSLMDGSHPGSNRFPRAYYSAMYDWLRQNLSQEGWRLLDDLPISIQIEAAPGHELCVCHASPEDPSSRSCSPEYSPKELLPMYESHPAEVIAFGHAHKPHVRWLDGRLFVNVASVAFRQDATSMLTLLNCEDGPMVSSRTGMANWTVEQFRVPYDIHKERKRMKQRNVPVPEDYIFEAVTLD